MILFLGLAGCSRDPGPEGRIVILVGLDGFRWDYLEKFQPPVLMEMARRGVTTPTMVPSFPTLTFPNFYTLATGLRPENHGIIANSMFDPEFEARFSLGSPAVQEGRWWGGEPIWITAEKQGVRAACMFWPGSEAEIGGWRPSDWRKYQHTMPPEERVDTVLDWLARPPAERPRLITLYFHEADSAGHRYGADAPETAAAVAQVDLALGALQDGVRRLGLEDAVNYVIVSDHGMTGVSPDRVIALDQILDLETVQVDFAGAVAGLRPRQGTVDDLYAALSVQPTNYQVFRREDLPERLHFRSHRRIPPVVLIPDEGWMVVREAPRSEGARRAFLRATHGFDPALPSMGALFIASGPALRRGVILPPFENIHIYSLVCTLLGLHAAPNQGDTRLGDRAIFKKYPPAIPAILPLSSRHRFDRIRKVQKRRGGRAVDCTGLENRRGESLRGFESHPLRHDPKSPANPDK